SEAVARFYNPSTNCRQCVIANVQLKRDDCCTSECASEDDLDYNVPQPLESVLNRFGADGGADLPDQPAELEKVQREINRGCPVCVRILWDAGEGHFVVITGYVPGTSRLYVQDPFGPHEGEVSYSALSTNY